MAEETKRPTVPIVLVVVAIGALVAWAGSDGGDRLGNVPVFIICGALAFGINWLAFIPSAIAQTEHYYDLVGGITYLTVMGVAVAFSQTLDARAALVAAMVLVWSIRLASFLFMRISKSGTDSRFDEIKTEPGRFLVAWTLQGLWVLLTAAAALAIVTGGVREPLGPVGMLGIAVWVLGMAIEVISDRQKSAFKADPANSGRFISSGLWAWSRHPNYFGEIVLWLGIAIVALEVLHGWQWVTLVSPVFVALLLTKVSGVPMLEAKADERWGGQPDYEAYKARTPVLVLKPPARS